MNGMIYKCILQRETYTYESTTVDKLWFEKHLCRMFGDTQTHNNLWPRGVSVPLYVGIWWSRGFALLILTYNL